MLYSADPGLILGFHGCDARVMRAVALRNIQLRSSSNDWDWLGHGIYFWQNNYERALDYARHPPPGVSVHEPAAIGAVISLGHCLDLSDKRWIDLVRDSYNNLRTEKRDAGAHLPVNLNPRGSRWQSDRIIRRLDCAVISNIHRLISLAGEQPFDSVRGIFHEGRRLYKGAGFHDKTHVQLCIRNPNCIKGYFVPREEEPWSPP